MRQLDELDDPRMDRRLATRELDNLGIALRSDKRVEHERDLLNCQRVPVRLMTRVGKTDRTVKIARRIDLDDPQTRVLLVLRTDTAVKRTAIPNLALELKRDRPRPVETLLRHIQLGVGIDERLEQAMLQATLAHDHTTLAHVDLSVDHRLTNRANRLRVLKENLVALDPLRSLSTHPHTPSRQ